MNQLIKNIVQKGRGEASEGDPAPKIPNPKCSWWPNKKDNC